MNNRKTIIGTNIKFFRKTKGLNQQQLADNIGIKRQAVSNWERYVSEPSSKNLYKIAAALGIPIDQLTTDNSNPSASSPVQDIHVRKIVREELDLRELQFESTELNLNIPPPPDELEEEDLKEYDRNAGLLLRWAHTDKAQKTFPNGVEEYALERFCIEAAGFYSGGWIDDVSGLLKDFIEEGKR